MTDVEFLRVWAHWDERPHDPKRAEAMEDAAKLKATELGLKTSHLRTLLVEWRRAGLKRSEALLAVQAGLLAREEPQAP